MDPEYINLNTHGDLIDNVVFIPKNVTVNLYTIPGSFLYLNPQLNLDSDIIFGNFKPSVVIKPNTSISDINLSIYNDETMNYADLNMYNSLLEYKHYDDNGSPITYSTLSLVLCKLDKSINYVINLACCLSSEDQVYDYSLSVKYTRIDTKLAGHYYFHNLLVFNSTIKYDGFDNINDIFFKYIMNKFDIGDHVMYKYMLDLSYIYIPNGDNLGKLYIVNSKIYNQSNQLYTTQSKFEINIRYLDQFFTNSFKVDRKNVIDYFTKLTTVENGKCVEAVFKTTTYQDMLNKLKKLQGRNPEPLFVSTCITIRCPELNKLFKNRTSLLRYFNSDRRTSQDLRDLKDSIKKKANSYNCTLGDLKRDMTSAIDVLIKDTKCMIPNLTYLRSGIEFFISESLDKVIVIPKFMLETILKKKDCGEILKSIESIIDSPILNPAGRPYIAQYLDE